MFSVTKFSIAVFQLQTKSLLLSRILVQFTILIEYVILVVFDIPSIHFCEQFLLKFYFAKTATLFC